MLQQRGWQVIGIEPNPGAAARARERLGTGAVRQSPFERTGFEAASFDLITLWDVLDHLQSPPSALHTLRSWLRPGGLLVLGVFDLTSWDARLFGRAWLGWDAPRHAYLFPKKALRGMLQEAGLEVVAARSFYGGYGSFVTSLDTLLQERLGATWGGCFLQRLAGMRLWRYLLWPYFRLAEWTGRGPIRTYFCRLAP
jgi:SAM-dependent methyltransferase